MIRITTVDIYGKKQISEEFSNFELEQFKQFLMIICPCALINNAISNFEKLEISVVVRQIKNGKDQIEFKF